MQEQTYKDEITGQTDRRYMTALELSQALHEIEEVIDSIRRFYKADEFCAPFTPRREQRGFSGVLLITAGSRAR